MSTAAQSAATVGSAASNISPADPETINVNISIPKHVHAHFSRVAKAEDRTLNNLLKRKLVALHDAEQEDVA